MTEVVESAGPQVPDVSSHPQQMSWTDNPNAPRVPYYLYIGEEAYFAGIIIASILYGTHETAPHIHPSNRIQCVRSVCSRGPHRAVLPMYDRTAEPRYNLPGVPTMYDHYSPDLFRPSPPANFVETPSAEDSK